MSTPPNREFGQTRDSIMGCGGVVGRELLNSVVLQRNVGELEVVR
jgi:hypothetical protein